MRADRDYSSSGDSGSDGSCGRSQEVNESFTRSLAELSGSNEGNGAFVHAPVAAGHAVMEYPVMLPHGMNMGMEYWSRSAVPSGHEVSKPQYVLAHTGTIPFNADAKGNGNMWLSQDNKEQKREKRKQANRESARRSRMRKQFEYEELAEKVASLTAENDTLKSEVNRLGDLYRKLSSERSALLERVQKARI